MAKPKIASLISLRIIQLINAIHVVNYIKTINNNTMAKTWKMAFRWMEQINLILFQEQLQLLFILFLNSLIISKHSQNVCTLNECNLLLKVTNRTSVVWLMHTYAVVYFNIIYMDHTEHFKERKSIMLAA